MYDLIGDIHGHADALVQLLELLGYRQVEGVYRHPDRQAIFLGDFIDRGPKIRQVLRIVRPMVEHKSALAVMGNHEWNALAFQADDPKNKGGHLRPRCYKNIRQHAQTILQLTDEELTGALDWFRTLPLWLDLDGLRVVHACWDESSMAMIQSAIKAQGGILTDAFLQAASEKGNPLYDAVEIVLKGKEVPLPGGVPFVDKDGHPRSRTRVRWYLPPHGHTYRTYAWTDAIDCDEELTDSLIKVAAPYPAEAPPVFVGHYWLSSKQPEILAPNVACVDYSVAKGGFLCAYRWQGEQQLCNDQFAWHDRLPK